MRRFPSLAIALGVLFLLSLPQHIHAQEIPTEYKTQELSAFGGYSIVHPDFAPSDDKGITAGATFTSFLSHFPIDPSIELRGTYASGPVLNERTVDFGVQVSRRFRRFHPYADFLVGVGSIVFKVEPSPGEHVDKGLVYTFGGGLDYDLIRNFRLRVDAQEQKWNLGQNETLKPNGGDFTLTPFLFTIGVNYVIPFHPRVSYKDTH